jgi:hypothetical protein
MMISVKTPMPNVTVPRVWWEVCSGSVGNNKRLITLRVTAAKTFGR